VNSPWLQNGYKKIRNDADCPDWADYLDKKRIKSADNYGLDRSVSRVGIREPNPGSLAAQGFREIFMPR
jgi:hypothetical protein